MINKEKNKKPPQSDFTLLQGFCFGFCVQPQAERLNLF